MPNWNNASAFEFVSENCTPLELAKLIEWFKERGHVLRWRPPEHDWEMVMECKAISILLTYGKERKNVRATVLVHDDVDLAARFKLTF